MAPMIVFDDGTSWFSLGPSHADDRGALSEREARWVLERWMAREPWRSQLRRYAASELLVEARTDEALLDRMWALLGSRGLALRQDVRTSTQDPSARPEAIVATLEPPESTIASALSKPEDEEEEEGESVSYFVQFRAVDKETGEAIEAVPYRLVLRNGTKIEGETDDRGYTLRIGTVQPEEVELIWLTSVDADEDDEGDEPEGC